MPFKIVRNDITKMQCDAIVNTAAAYPEVGAGCDTAIYTAAGYDRLLAYRQEKIGYVREGDVFLTPSFDLPVSCIIHAVSPLFKDGQSGEEEKLRSCYRKSLKLAYEHNVQSIAFPLISTGSFGYPKEEGMRIAVDEINAFLLQHEMMIYLVVFEESAVNLGKRIYPGLESYISQNYVAKTFEEEYGIAEVDAEFGSHSFEDNDIQKNTIGGLDGSQRRNKPGIIDRIIPNINSEQAKIQNRLQQSDSARFGRRKSQKGCLNEDIPPDCEDKKSLGTATVRASEPKDGEEKASLSVEALCMETDSEELTEFGEQHESKLRERMQHMSDTFSQYLLYLISERGMTNAEVYKRGIVDKKVFSKIKNNPNYHPDKMTAMCLCVGARLNPDETKDLLARAGYSLSPCDKRDIIFSYFIENQIYDMIELDIQLEEHGLKCLIS